MMQQNPLPREVEENLRSFYDSKGWSQDGAHTGDAARWEDTRACAHSYVSGCRLRLLKYLPRQGELILDAASGPIQYPEYLAYSAGYVQRVCVDLSKEALSQAEAKLGAKGQYLNCSILDLPLADRSMDASLSLHTIYHIEASAQESAVRQLLRVTKAGRPVLVIYANPDRLSAKVANVARSLKRLFTGMKKAEAGEIYYFAHPLSWWQRFSDEAEVSVVTWRTLTAKLSRMLPDNVVGSFVLKVIFQLEEAFPRAMLPFAAYPLVVLTKRNGK
ncbi:MAG TPA: class I SAM-dependent methyltransferase [Bdellovibrionota bacterium]|jgi:SAM-dependent methyltransferase